MLNLPATLAWYFFLLCVIWIFQGLTRCFTTINIFTLFVVFLLMRHGLTVPFDNNVNEWLWGGRISLSDESLLRFYIGLVLMYVFILLGIYCGQYLLGSAHIAPEDFAASVKAKVLPGGINPILFGLVILCGVGLVIVVQLPYGISITDRFSGLLTNIAYRDARRMFSEETHFTSGIWQRLANIVRYGLFPMFIATLYMLKDRSLIWRVAFLGVLGLGIIVGIKSGQKAPALYLLATLPIANYLQHGINRIDITSRRLWLFVGLGFFLALPYLYILQYPGITYENALITSFYRLTREYNRGLQLYFQIYPNVHPFMFGTSSNLISNLLGNPVSYDTSPERFIPTYYLGSYYLNTWNAAYIGNAWADFGFFGIVFESIFVGILLQGFAVWFRREPKTLLVLGTQTGLIMTSTWLAEVSLTSSLLTFGLLSSFLVFWVVKRYTPYRQIKR